MSTVRRRSRSSLPTVPARRGSVQVTEAQRLRMLSSAAAVVSRYGFEQMSVARVTAHARVSRRTFYDVFENREDCFLAVFDDAVARVTEQVLTAYHARERTWREQVRAGLTALLLFMDEHPHLGSLLVVDALRAGPRVLSRRAKILARLGAALDEGRVRSKNGRGLAEITGEGVVGAVFSVIHARLSVKRPRPLIELLNPLMSVIVLPYLGSAAAQRELERPAPKLAHRSDTRAGNGRASSSAALARAQTDPLEGLPMRLTYRTLRVLGAIGEMPGASNREVSESAGVVDQGQMSKLLARLERLGLICNVAGQGHQPTGEPNSWRLTTRGEEVQDAITGGTGWVDGQANGCEESER